MERGAAPAMCSRKGAAAARITPRATSPLQRTTVRTSREAFVKTARRHYDRQPAARLKGGVRAGNRLALARSAGTEA